MKRRDLYPLFLLSVLLLGLVPFFLYPKISVTTGSSNGHAFHTRSRQSGASFTVGVSGEQTTKVPSDRCAILFFGLPRSFQRLVLPSIVRNILIPNQKPGNRCDIYVHYYHVNHEGGGRSGEGGSITPQEVNLLRKAAILDPASWSPLVSITFDTEQDFSNRRGKQLEKYRKARGPDGNYLYFPWMAKTYIYPTSLDNIVRQWHSIQSAWELMEQTAASLKINYTRVAMLRIDAVYVTPFEIHNLSSTLRDDANEFVAVPNWARFPVNDRLIYGNYKAVKVWATERFSRLEDHVITYEEAGYGMHSERFLNHSIFPAIRDLGFGVTTNPDICFFRARADGSAWINDCATRNGAAKGFRGKINAQALVEQLVGHKCERSKFGARIVQLQCDLQINQTVRVGYRTAHEG